MANGTANIAKHPKQDGEDFFKVFWVVKVRQYRQAHDGIETELNERRYFQNMTLSIKRRNASKQFQLKGRLP